MYSEVLDIAKMTNLHQGFFLGERGRDSGAGQG